jgi:hypothetical protein
MRRIVCLVIDHSLIVCLVIDHSLIQSEVLRSARTEGESVEKTLQNCIGIYDQKRRKTKYFFLWITREILVSTGVLISP